MTGGTAQTGNATPGLKPLSSSHLKSAGTSGSSADDAKNKAMAVDSMPTRGRR